MTPPGSQCPPRPHPPWFLRDTPTGASIMAHRILWKVSVSSCKTWAFRSACGRPIASRISSRRSQGSIALGHWCGCCRRRIGGRLSGSWRRWGYRRRNQAGGGLAGALGPRARQWQFRANSNTRQARKVPSIAMARIRGPGHRLGPSRRPRKRARALAQRGTGKQNVWTGHCFELGQFQGRRNDLQHIGQSVGHLQSPYGKGRSRR